MRFQSRATFAFATTVAALSTVISVTARAQPAPGDVSGTAAVTGYTQFNTKLDSGGRFNWAGGLGSASLTRQFTPQLSIGLAARIASGISAATRWLYA